MIGAIAPDILIRDLLGVRPEHATKDIDVAVAFQDWAAYDRVTSTLQRSVGPGHRFLVHEVDVDIIPFSGIESPGRSITWPDEMAMDVHGFAEAHRHAVVVRMPGGLDLGVASLPPSPRPKSWRGGRGAMRATGTRSTSGRS